VTQGRELYVEYCASCHGAKADGVGPAAEAMDPRPADLRRIAARRGGVFPAAAITDKIDGRDPIKAHGSKDMPVWGKVFRNDAELEHGTETAVRGRILVLVEYLTSIQVP
jgi:mono/diheme cytochrome c family protein